MDIEELEREGKILRPLPGWMRPEMSPLENLREMEFTQILEHCLEDCTEREKEAVRLVEFSGYTNEEAAQVMFIDRKTVIQYRTDARKKIRRGLQRLGYRGSPVFTGKALVAWMDKFIRAYERIYEHSSQSLPLVLYEARLAHNAIIDLIKGDKPS